MVDPDPHPEPVGDPLLPPLRGEGLIGPIFIQAGPAFSARTRLAIRGLNVDVANDLTGEKEKVSLTLDRELLEDLRSRAGDAPLSAVVNELLRQALKNEDQRALLEDLIAEGGEPSPEAYERVLEQWFGEERG